MHHDDIEFDCSLTAFPSLDRCSLVLNPVLVPAVQTDRVIDPSVEMLNGRHVLFSAEICLSDGR